MQQLFQTQLGRLRLIAFVEGISFLIILFVTMPLKYWMDYPTPNKFFGMSHGILFIWYVWAVLRITYMHKWKLSKAFLALVASIVPFGTFWADKYLFQDGGKREAAP